MTPTCSHEFLRQRTGDNCPVCVAPPPPRELCTHDFLRARNAGVCPICHPTFAKYGMAPSELHAQVREEKRRRMRKACLKSLATFFRESWHVLEPTVDFQDSWIFDELGRHCQTVFNEWRKAKRKKNRTASSAMSEFQNFVATLPPGTAKSRFISVAFVAWAWLHDPTMTVTALSVNPFVAKRDADYCRQLVQSEWYRETFRPKWQLQEDANAVGYFRIITPTGQKLGHRRSFGIDAKVIGSRTDLLLVDDPIDPNDILGGNLLVLTRTIAKWNGLFNRVNDPSYSMRMCVMQRVHKQDLAGYMLSQTDQKWLHLNIPLTRRETQTENALHWIDPRMPGERIMPTRYTDEVVRIEQNRLGDLAWAWLEQDPRDFGGAIFKAHNFRFFRFADTVAYHARPAGSNNEPALVLEQSNRGRWFDRMLISIDCNMASETAKAKGSEVGMQVCGIKGYDRFIVKDFSKALGFDDMIDAVKAELAAWPEINKVIVENKALGPAAAKTLKKHVLNVVEIQPSGSKEARARAVAMQVNAGRVYLLDGAEWLKPYCEQVYAFPATPDGRNDRVDATTQFLNNEDEDDTVARYLKLAKN